MPDLYEWDFKVKFVESKIIDVQAHDSVTIMLPSNVYGCKLGENVFVGPFCEIQSDVEIGAGTRIQSHTFICSLVTIGKDCFVGHGVVFINDLFQTGGPARGDKAQWKSTTIQDEVSIGSNSTILPVNICSGVVIGAGSVVTGCITEPGTYAGNPARKIK